MTTIYFIRHAEPDYNNHDDFRERKIDNVWIEDFNGFCKQQWSDFNYKLTDGESLNEVQIRNIRALEEVVYNFNAIRSVMPWVVKFEFDDKKCVFIEEIDME